MLYFLVEKQCVGNKAMESKDERKIQFWYHLSIKKKKMMGENEKFFSLLTSGFRLAFSRNSGRTVG